MEPPVRPDAESIRDEKMKVFCIRAGKNLPVTCTEIVVRLRPVPTIYQGATTWRRESSPTPTPSPGKPRG